MTRFGPPPIFAGKRSGALPRSPLVTMLPPGRTGDTAVSDFGLVARPEPPPVGAEPDPDAEPEAEPLAAEAPPDSPRLLPPSVLPFEVPFEPPAVVELPPGGFSDVSLFGPSEFPLASFFPSSRFGSVTAGALSCAGASFLMPAISPEDSTFIFSISFDGTGLVEPAARQAKLQSFDQHQSRLRQELFRQDLRVQHQRFL